MRIRVKHCHFLPRLLRVNAITIYPWVLFADARDEVRPRTAAHELVHLRQIENDGWGRFHLRYARDFSAKLLTTFSYRAAMRETEYEREAYHCEHSPGLQRNGADLGMWE